MSPFRIGPDRMGHHSESTLLAYTSRVSRSRLPTALKTVSDSGWESALVLVGSATAHLEASKLSSAHANTANCTE